MKLFVQVAPHARGQERGFAGVVWRESRQSTGAARQSTFRQGDLVELDGLQASLGWMKVERRAGHDLEIRCTTDYAEKALRGKFVPQNPEVAAMVRSILDGWGSVEIRRDRPTARLQAHAARAAAGELRREIVCRSPQAALQEPTELDCSDQPELPLEAEDLRVEDPEEQPVQAPPARRSRRKATPLDAG